MSVKKVLSSKLKKNYTLFMGLVNLRTWINKLHTEFRGGYTVDNQGCTKIIEDIIGINNHITIQKGSFLHKTRIHIRGNNNSIVFQENVSVGNNCSFWMEGNNISIIIGKGSTFVHSIHFCAQENDVKILVGEDCMFSNNIIVRTSDSHPIFDCETNTRINKAKNVVIGKHVWIAPNSKIFKGAIIEDGSIIGSNSLVTRNIPANSLAVGSPAKVVKTNIKWTRDKLF